MSEPAPRVPFSAPGRWYVDTNCSTCDACLEEAPSLLRHDEDRTFVYFIRQPRSRDEEDAARRAMDICPCHAIHDDG